MYIHLFLIYWIYLGAYVVKQYENCCIFADVMHRFHHFQMSCVIFYFRLSRIMFTFSDVMYRVLIFPRLKLSGGATSANCWLSLAGQLGETEKLPLPKHTLDVSIKVYTDF